SGSFVGVAIDPDGGELFASEQSGQLRAYAWPAGTSNGVRAATASAPHGIAFKPASVSNTTSTTSPSTTTSTTAPVSDANANTNTTAPASDADGDGVDDGVEPCFCLGTPSGSRVTHLGCSADQLCPCAAPLGRTGWLNHGEYVRCVKNTAKDLA